MSLKLDQMLEGISSVAMAGHVRPDGDCVGSCLATYNYIKNNYPGITVDLYLEPIPNLFKFLTSSEDIQTVCDNNRTYDLFIALDCGDAGRLGQAAEYFKTAKTTLCIDHHKSNQAFAEVNYIYPEASSTCELVYELLDENRLTKEIAECIYVGIIHDTGVFQYSSTSSKTMKIAGKLMDMGIDYPTIVNDTFFVKTFEQNRILGHALLKAQRFLDNRCIYSCITRQEMQQYNVLPKHLEGIVSQMRSTKDVEAAIFLYQNEEDNYKVSMRSGKVVDVAKIAVKYGGGGHTKAAGVTMQGQEADIKELLLKEVAKQLC